eukprot:COSAG01_NODE_1304_length_10809_cov_2.635387_4_plen_554_part_00
MHLAVVLLVGTAAALGVPAAPYVLDLAPAAPPATQAYHNATLSTWGGNVVRDPKGNFHLFAAAMTLGCNLGAWTSNSEVIHAVSPQPTGPFQLRNVALPPWHHNPQAVLHPDGTWLLYTIGTVGVPAQHHCRKAGAAADAAAQASPPPLGVRGPKTGEFVQLHYSRSPDGPWTFLNLTGDPANPGIFGGGTTDNHDHGTNPTPWVMNNGTVVVGSHDSTGFYIQVAPHWRGPYRRVPGHLFTFPSHDRTQGYVFEDPFLFFDAAAQRWRCLMHEYTLGHGGHHLGGAAVSLTPELLGPWRLQPVATPAYTLRVADAAGGSELMARRERPKLLLDAQGRPLVLYTAVCPGQPKGNGLCYTHAQRIAGESQLVNEEAKSVKTGDYNFTAATVSSPPPPPPPNKCRAGTFPLCYPAAESKGWACMTAPGAAKDKIGKAIQWACGAGGVDCSAIDGAAGHQGACWDSSKPAAQQSLASFGDYVFQKYWSAHCVGNKPPPPGGSCPGPGSPSAASCGFGGAARLKKGPVLPVCAGGKPSDLFLCNNNTCSGACSGTMC